MPCLAITAWIWALAEVRKAVSFGPKADELSKLADLRWGDPAFRQVVPAQAVGELGGVALVVFHPPRVPVQSERVDEMHSCAVGLEEIGRPVPAIGALEGHLGIGAGPRDREGELERIVLDPDGLEHAAVLGHAHDHRPPPVQVDSHILSLLFHRSLLLSFPGWFGHPECALHARFPATGGTPAVRRRLCGPFGHGILASVGARARTTGLGHAEAALRSFMTSARRSS